MSSSQSPAVSGCTNVEQRTLCDQLTLFCVDKDGLPGFSPPPPPPPNTPAKISAKISAELCSVATICGRWLKSRGGLSVHRCVRQHENSQVDGSGLAEQRSAMTLLHGG